MAVNLETLEHHHNALQVQFNLLLLVLAETNRGVVEDWLGVLRHTLNTEPKIPPKQRELMDAQFNRMAQHVTGL